jgi:hypothetical protein
MNSSSVELSTILDRIIDKAADNLRFAKLLVQLGLGHDNVTYNAIFNRLLEIFLAAPLAEPFQKHRSSLPAAVRGTSERLLLERATRWGRTPCNCCVRFATAVANGHATLATKRTLTLTWAGLTPAGSHQLSAGTLIQ